MKWDWVVEREWMYGREDDRAGVRETIGKRGCRAKGEKKIKGAHGYKAS